MSIKLLRHLGTHQGSTNPLRPVEAAAPAQSVFKGEVLEEAIQIASNEFLMRDVASGEEKGVERDPR